MVSPSNFFNMIWLSEGKRQLKYYQEKYEKVRYNINIQYENIKATKNKITLNRNLKNWSDVMKYADSLNIRRWHTRKMESKLKKYKHKIVEAQRLINNERLKNANI